MKTLHVISVVSNPLNWNSRSELFHKFIVDMILARESLFGSEYSLSLTIVECLYPTQVSCISSDLLPEINYVGVHSDSIIWNKENLVNIGIKNLPSDYEYVAWVDGDISFKNDNWVIDTIETLDSHGICQLWEEAHDLNYDDSIMMVHRSFCSQASTAKLSNISKIYTTWHSGYAWGATRYAIEKIGGLYEVGILGSADNYMAWAFIGKIDSVISGRLISQSEIDYLYAWQERAIEFNDLGSVPGIIEHYYHGSKKDRGYGWRWRIAVNNDFNPSTDVSFNNEGVIEFAGNKPKLVEDVLGYFKSRNEDAVSLVVEPIDYHE